MKFPQLLLIVSGAIFLGYGVLCWYNPELPAEYAGLFIGTHNGYAEMAAMYGGLQTGLGALLLASAFSRGYLRSGLWLLLVGVGCIAAARGSIALSDLDSSFRLTATSLGMNMSSGFTVYTWGALAFEFLVALLAGIALISRR